MGYEEDAYSAYKTLDDGRHRALDSRHRAKCRAQNNRQTQSLDNNRLEAQDDCGYVNLNESDKRSR